MKYLKWINKNLSRLDNKNIIVTGANSGIGLEASKVFAYLGANVIMACRSLKRANNAKEEILKEVPNAKIDIIEYDQSSLTSITNFVNEYTNKYKDLYALVNNAGIYHPEKNSLASNGYPLTIMTNFYGGYYLVNKMFPFIKIQAECIISFECSVAANMSKVKSFDYLTNSLKNTNIEYNLSKCAIGKEFLYFKEELKDYQNIKVMMSHPGITPTNIFTSKGNSFSKFFKSLARVLLPVFVHPVAKACLGLVSTVANERLNNYTYLGPRGFAQLSGYPKPVKVSKFIRYNIDDFIKEVNKNIDLMEVKECLK